MDKFPGGAASEGFARPGEIIDGNPAVDAKWRTQWQTILFSKGLPDGVGTYNLWKQTVGPNLTEEELERRYTMRWGGAPFGNSPWRGLFESNLTSTKLVNAFNSDDQVFDLRSIVPSVWQICTDRAEALCGRSWPDVT